MTLSQNQIEQLFSFTEKKFVSWYDLQVELVDHLAEKIEAQMEQDSTLSFDRALENVYAGFGIFGFAQIVREKEKALRKANHKMLWKEICNQFTWPNLVRSFAILALILTIAFQVNIKTLAIITLSLYFIDIAFNGQYSLGRFLLNYTKKVTVNIAKKKKLLMLQNLPAFSFGSMLYLQFMAMRYFNTLSIESTNASMGFKIYFSILLFIGVLIHISAKNISLAILNKAKTLYPEAFA